MKIVDTASPKMTVVARTPDGKIDFKAYIGLHATYEINELNVEVEITDARTRFGHLDLLVQPRAGTGIRWVERKNLVIDSDPAINVWDPEESFGVEEAVAAATSVANLPVLPTAVEWHNSPEDTHLPTAGEWHNSPEETHMNLADEVREIINRASLK